VSRSAPAADAGPVSPAEAEALFAGLSPYPNLLLALSGGPDSTALLFLIARWRAVRAAGPQLSAATVDHGLRAEARAEARAAGAVAARLGVPHAVLRWTGAKPAAGIEAAARRARYRLLAGEARRIGAAAVVLAHTLDDQAETVLMRLAAGSGPAGLAAMRPVETVEGLALLRPLLGLPKARLLATLADAGLAAAADPMNADPRFARPRLRAARAALAREGLTPARLARLAARMARAEAVVAEAAAALGARSALAGPPGRLDGRLLAAAPEELALRVLGGAIAAAGGAPAGAPPLRLQRLEYLWSELKPALAAGRRLRRTLAGALVAVGTDGTLEIGRAPPRRRNVATAAESAKPRRRAPAPAAKTFTRNDAV
jgi:tRNA(Ile)-lysidine synthase